MGSNSTSSHSSDSDCELLTTFTHLQFTEIEKHYERRALVAVRGVRINLGTSVHHGIVICIPQQDVWVFDWGN